jgi:hypothetical protein
VFFLLLSVHGKPNSTRRSIVRSLSCFRFSPLLVFPHLLCRSLGLFVLSFFLPSFLSFVLSFFLLLVNIEYMLCEMISEGHKDQQQQQTQKPLIIEGPSSFPYLLLTPRLSLLLSLRFLPLVRVCVYDRPSASNDGHLSNTTSQ